MAFVLVPPSTLFMSCAVQARNVALKAHGQKTAYAVMLDADHTMDNTWRMRLACSRLAKECARR